MTNGHILARRRACARSALAASLAALATSCIDSTAQQNTAQAIIDMGNEVSALRQDNAVLQEQIDSLKTALARQDTAVRRLSQMAGLPQ